MTRASLLHILNHVGSISEAEIRELEQLAAAFPYCQTAHVLLAKAAHDQGSMLASQRLRRAATYAADRQLLRQLLEQPTPETTTIELSAPKELPAPPEANLPAAAVSASSSTAFIQSLVTEDVQLLETQEEEATTVVEETATEVQETSVPEPVAVFDPIVAEQETDVQEAVDSTQAHTEQVESELEEPGSLDTIEPLASVETPEEVAKAPEESIETLPVSSADSETEATVPEPVEPFLSTSEVDSDSASIATDDTQAVDVVNAPDAELEVLPAVAPPIRPPAEVGTSRFEFGLSEPNKLPVPILYQLPGLDEEETVEEADEEYNLFPPASTTVLAPPFRVDTDVAYSLLEGGSRFGYALQMRDDELTQPLPATEFFPPDALLHAHASSANQPRSIPTPSSFDLINRFLKVQPRLKAPGVLPTVNEQTDLAARSTHAPPALASESLAKILIKQGKTERAIEIYEQLMVRQPEKSAYFADQIQQLKSSE
ncbi:hypothetical protein [Hymenobacter volaticus]|uniref:Tetratricopeptide repeat protein n=1 Tax=Hymenobacter volaticus TaxID=2932254 RepID=A0ABY4G0P3_9BACT|nr:hypothetical protein [Hymenobacter volaticus]UOQ64450.1 hypothetical protein MUN86_12705 [Hymenobacter volaticus]